MTYSTGTSFRRHEIIPRPAVFKNLPGCFTLNRNTVIAADAGAENTGKYLAEMLAPATGFRLKLKPAHAAPRANAIILGILPASRAYGDEGYEILARPDTVRIGAAGAAGLFYACQTLRQMLPKEILSAAGVVSRPWRIPCTAIRDRPRFPWRGLMLDTARYFHPKDFILRYIDMLAFYKMNRLHLHLNDTQAWTLEIKKYPRLTDPETRWPPGEKERGAYSQKDMREIAEYGAARHVMVIPEFDLPCHARAILNAYPELICSHIPRPAGSHDHGEMCAGREEVYEFIDDILSEMASIFSAPYIHIGGDEYGGWSWEKCPDCQNRLKAERLEAEDKPELRRLFSKCQGSSRKYLLYRYMMRRVARMVVAKNRVPVLWDDMAWRGQFPDKSVIMQWHYQGAFDWMQNADTPENPAREAAEAGHGAIIAPHSHYYFDFLHGGAMLRRLYEFDHVPPGLAAGRHPFILGPHACSWERRPADVDWKVFPRLLAMAEKGWTAGPLCRWNNFQPRLKKHLSRLKILGVRYAKPKPWPLKKMVHKWEAPARAGWQTSWLINEIIAGNGSYGAKVVIRRGKNKKSATGLCLATDGHEFVQCARVKRNKQNSGIYLFRFKIKSYNPDSLYMVRLSLKRDGATACSGEIIFNKLLGHDGPRER
jgi:hexosaminidase